MPLKADVDDLAVHTCANSTCHVCTSVGMVSGNITIFEVIHSWLHVAGIRIEVRVWHRHRHTCIIIITAAAATGPLAASSRSGSHVPQQAQDWAKAIKMVMKTLDELLFVKTYCNICRAVAGYMKVHAEQ